MIGNYHTNNFIICVFAFLVVNSLLNEATPYPGPPVVPKRLDRPEDIQKYIDKLKQYYLGKTLKIVLLLSFIVIIIIKLVAGRPRFGKRKLNEMNDYKNIGDLMNELLELEKENKKIGLF